MNLPFIVVNMARETEIDCSISEDQFEYHLKFSREFELHDELEILKRLGLADATNAENLLPPKLRHFLRLGQNSERKENLRLFSLSPVNPRHFFFVLPRVASGKC